MTKERNAEFKPLSFSTTLRSPNRMAGFLNCIIPFEGQILTNDVIHEIVVKMIGGKLYYTQKYEMKIPEYVEIFKSDDKSFTREQIEDIILNSPQEHKEAGFDKGWPSRFDTWFELAEEFGFVKYSIGYPIQISTTGHMLVDAYNEETPNNEKIQTVFLNSLMKYQTNNPYRKNANTNCPLILLLQTIKLLKQKDENSAGISRQEIPLLICWPDSNANSVYDKILQMREEYHFNVSDEIVYDECLKLLNATEEQKNRFKMSQITGEAVDDYIRKMRITGILSLRGNGRFLDINNFEETKANYILENYSSYKSFISKDEYFDYMGKIDSFIISSQATAVIETQDIKEQSLIKWANYFSTEEIETELTVLSKNQESKNEIIRIIDKPTRLEFLTSISLKQKFSNVKVIPNYKIDDEGLPTFTAAGGIADIECFDNDCKPLVEVTMMTARTQATNEMPAITRHLQERIDKYKDTKVFTIFIAPSLHSDSLYMVKFSKFQYNVDIIALTVIEYLQRINNFQKLSEFC